MEVFSFPAKKMLGGSFDKAIVFGFYLVFIFMANEMESM